MKLSSRSSASRARLARIAVISIVALLASACGSEGESAAPIDVAEADTATVSSDAAAFDEGGFSSDFSDDLAPDEPFGEHTPDFGSTLSDFLGDVRQQANGSAPPPGFTEIEWQDLVPDNFSAADISAKFEERMASIEPGSPEANEVFAEMQAEFDNQPVNPDMAGQAVQLAGFVAPLTYVDDLVTEFLLVPYFGACIHVPPPPVNQTVMVSLEDGQGLSVEESWGAVWVVGTLTIDGLDTDIGTAGYTIIGAQTGVYEQF